MRIGHLIVRLRSPLVIDRMPPKVWYCPNLDCPKEGRMRWLSESGRCETCDTGLRR